MGKKNGVLMTPKEIREHNAWNRAIREACAVFTKEGACTESSVRRAMKASIEILKEEKVI